MNDHPKFIIETGARHLGIKLFVCRVPNARRTFELRGERAAAAEFPSRSIANGVRGQFSSAYGLEIVSVA